MTTTGKPATIGKAPTPKAKKAAARTETAKATTTGTGTTKAATTKAAKAGTATERPSQVAPAVATPTTAAPRKSPAAGKATIGKGTPKARAAAAQPTKLAADATRTANAPGKPIAATAALPLATLSTIATHVAAKGAMTMRAAKEIVDEVFVEMTNQLTRGATIRIAEFGTLEVRQRGARVGRNPATGQPVAIAASRKISFRPAKALREAV